MKRRAIPAGEHHPHPISRGLFWGWSKPDGLGNDEQDIFDERAMEKLLAGARDRGVVNEYDAGNGNLVWFTGKPGPQLRALKARVLAMLPPGVVPLAAQGRA